MKQAERRYCEEGHDIQSAADMREAVLERPVQGVTASVCEVNGKQKSIDATKTPNFSAYHKADPEQVAIDMRNARNKDNARLFSKKRVAVEKPNPSVLYFVPVGRVSKLRLLSP